VLGADVIVLEPPRLIVCDDHDLPGTLGKSLEDDVKGRTAPTGARLTGCRAEDPSARHLDRPVDKIAGVSLPKRVERTPRSPRLGAAVELEELQGADVLNVIIDESALEDVALRDSDVKGFVARDVDLKRFVIAGVDLSGATLDGLGLRDGTLSGCDLANVSSRRCSLERVEIGNVRLIGAMFAEPRIVDVSFRDCVMNLASFRSGRLSRVRFEACRLVESDFQAATVNACTFIDCDLSGSELSQARFAGSAFRDCRLDGASGIEALRGAVVARGDLFDLAGVFAAALGVQLSDEIT
jgi:uncharacterized protein YjbI with pentapeptide repeats